MNYLLATATESPSFVEWVNAAGPEDIALWAFDLLVKAMVTSMLVFVIVVAAWIISLLVAFAVMGGLLHIFDKYREMKKRIAELESDSDEGGAA